MSISDKYRDEIKIAKLQEEKTDVGKLQSQMNDMQIMQKSMADMLIALNKDESQKIFDKNPDMRKYVDLVKNSDAILIKNSDGSDALY